MKTHGYAAEVDEEIFPAELYFALMDYEGDRAFDEVVAPWLARGSDRFRADLARFAVYDPSSVAAEPRESLWWLYALSRVSDLLLSLTGVVSQTEYLELFTTLGMTAIDATEFDPFFHEIVSVEQADDPGAPIEIADAEAEAVWPGLMLGEMLFSRQGVGIRAGARHAQVGVADKSPLYWTFRRADRQVVDLSHGWGHNSQWRTAFRRDYRTIDAVHLNVDRSGDIDDRSRDDEQEALITAAERRDLLRHRSLLRMPEAAAALAAYPGWDTDQWPFDWTLSTSLSS